MRNFYRKIGILVIVFWTKLIFAQSYTQNFDDITTLAGDGWVIQNNSTPVGSLGWFQGTATTATPTPGPFNSYNGATNSYIAANFNSTGNTGTISNWLITPNRTLRNGDVFTFYTRKPTINAGQTDYPDRLEVRMSTNGASTNVGAGATALGDFTTLLLSINPTLVANIYPQVWTQYTITVSGLPAPTSGRIAFRYFVTGAGALGTNSDYIGIDNVVYTPYVCPAFTMTPGGALTGGFAGVAYSTTLSQTGALGSPNFAIMAGSLPPGLSLSSSGTISGTPTATGTFNFTATVNDASGCSGSQSYSITVVCPSNPITISDFPVLCANSGVYTLQEASPAGGVYSGTGVSNGTFDPSVGTQIITYGYTDPYGCVYSMSKTITVNPALNTTINKTNVSCNGASDGSATVTVSGGTSPYTFVWSNNNGNTATATGLLPGSYSVTVTDSKGCSSVVDFIITQPAPINVVVTGNTTCANNSATLVASGADNYLWYNQPSDINPMVTGNSYVTPLLNSNTTFYTQGVLLSPQVALETTFSAGNNHRGNMFNVTAQKDLIITSFDVSPMGSTTVEVYYKEGTFSGFENSAAAWTKLGSSAVTYTGNPVNIEVGELTIPAGKTYALYVTSNNISVSLNYSNAASANDSYSDNNMTITTGVGLEYPFTSGTNQLYNPRTWNGRINYKLINCKGTPKAVEVTVNNTPAPTGVATQTFNAGDDLSVLSVNGQNIKWYASASDAENHTNVLPITTLIVNNTTYYATQTVGGCESQLSLAVKAYNESLSISDLSKKSQINIYPNPVKEVLNFSGTDKINKIVIMSIDGKRVFEKSLNGERKLNIHTLIQGAYLIKIFTDNGVQTIKFIKN